MTPVSNVVILVDDDETILHGLKLVLETEGYRVVVHSTAEDLLADLANYPRACVLADLKLPGMDGLALQREMQRRDANHPIIFMTGFGDVETAVDAMRHGAVDYIKKPVSTPVLLERIDQALKDEAIAHEFTANREELEQRLARVSKREMEVYDRVVDGMTNRGIATELKISERTVEVHRAQVMQKMQASTLAELIKMHVSLSG